eukprot:3434553-Rhodomonas_salina.1
MVRPSGSKENKEFCVSFMHALTVQVRSARPDQYTVGRAGPGSVFDVISQCYPQSVRENNRKG